MKRLMVRTGFVVLLLSTKSHAQSGTVIPPGEAAHAPQASCVILKRMGRVDRAKSRLPSLGIRGKQFRYVEGKLPEGFSSHNKMTDHDVSNLQARGAEVLVLDSHYTAEDLKQARASCPAQTGKTLIQAEAKAEAKAPSQAAAKATPAPAPALVASTPAPAPKPATASPLAPATGAIAGTSAPSAKPPAAKAPTLPTPKAPTPKASTPEAHYSPPPMGATEAALVDVSSTPAGADVYIDERFFGRTPVTTIVLMPGNYKIAVKKNGFVVWKKKLQLPSGRINVDAQLLAKAK